MLTGSLGMLPSASLGGKNGLYEPVHGSAPDIAGQGVANPLAAVASAAMLARFSLELPDASADIENAIRKFLNNGYRTSDIASAKDDIQVCDTAETEKLLISAISEKAAVSL